MSLRIFFAGVLLFTIPSFVATANTSKKEKNYQVEVAVFEITTDELVGGEQWTATETMAPQPPNAIIPQELPIDSKLQTALLALTKDAHYRILAQKGWIQSAQAIETTIPVRIQSENNDLDGAIEFYLSHYLHLDVNLQFRPSIPNAVPAIYKITESRRIKSQNINYFDNPKFGLLVRVTPIKAAAKSN